MMVLTLVLFAATGGLQLASAQNLTLDYYKTSCPNLQSIVQNAVTWNVTGPAGNKRLAAQLLRLFFHDCFVHVTSSHTLQIHIKICDGLPDPGIKQRGK
jgi:hypothetical protein